MSYLMETKTSLMELVDALREEVEHGGEDDLGAIFDDWKKALWPFVEQALKTSYRNGQRGNGTDKPRNRFSRVHKKE